MRWEVRGQDLGESGYRSVASWCKKGNEQSDSKTGESIIWNGAQVSWGALLQDPVCVSEQVVCKYTREAVPVCALTSCKGRIDIACSILNVETWWI